MFDRLRNKLTDVVLAPSRLKGLEFELDALRSSIDVSPQLVEDYREARGSVEFLSAYELPNPKVSVCIGTYNRSRLLVERSVQSVLDQTHDNLEVIVVGDCCTDNTEELMGRISDERVRFINLSERGTYPTEPILRWMVAGTEPFNAALRIANGAFITHLDDDDSYAKTRIEELVKVAQSTRADLIHHDFLSQGSRGLWRIVGDGEFRRGRVTTSAIFYHGWFKRLPWDINAYRLYEPGDWNRLRKFRYLGAKIVYYPRPLTRHYRERSQRS